MQLEAKKRMRVEAIFEMPAPLIQDAACPFFSVAAALAPNKTVYEEWNLLFSAAGEKPGVLYADRN